MKKVNKIELTIELLIMYGNNPVSGYLTIRPLGFILALNSTPPYLIFPNYLKKTYFDLWLGQKIFPFALGLVSLYD